MDVCKMDPCHYSMTKLPAQLSSVTTFVIPGFRPGHRWHPPFRSPQVPVSHPTSNIFGAIPALPTQLLSDGEWLPVISTLRKPHEAPVSPAPSRGPAYHCHRISISDPRRLQSCLATASVLTASAKRFFSLLEPTTFGITELEKRYRDNVCGRVECKRHASVVVLPLLTF